MIRFFVLICVSFLSFSTWSQGANEAIKVKEAVETFFEGFHARDSVLMKSVLAEEVVVQTIGPSKSGQPVLTQSDIHQVLDGIVSIPLETEFKEVIHSYDIRIDSTMANVWTPYSFHVNNALIHCGVNNFQLFRDQGDWKIIYLVDTRRKEGCQQP